MSNEIKPAACEPDGCGPVAMSIFKFSQIGNPLDFNTILASGTQICLKVLG